MFLKYLLTCFVSQSKSPIFTPMRYVRLKEEERKRLEELYRTNDNFVIKQRSICLLLSSDGSSIKEIGEKTGLSRRTIERLFNKWESSSDKYDALSIAPGRGAKVKLDCVKDILPEIVERNYYNLNEVLNDLKKNHNVRVCKLTLQGYLKSLNKNM